MDVIVSFNSSELTSNNCTISNTMVVNNTTAQPHKDTRCKVYLFQKKNRVSIPLRLIKV